MAGALVEIWLIVSALSSLAIVALAIGYSDLRIRSRATPASKAAIRPRRTLR